MKRKTVMIVSGEASGDIYGAQLVKAILEKSKNIYFCGIGGHNMKSVGVHLLIDIKKLSVMGITEIIHKIPIILKSIKHIKKTMKEIRPELLILIDFPDFNLHIASIAKKLNIPVLYYISPQIWAWRKGRIKKIKKLVDHMALILPFEERIYKKHKILATFVGHPLLDEIKLSDIKRINYNINDTHQINIGLLPGSRDKEISKLLPLMLEAAKIIQKKITSINFIVSHAKSINKKNFMTIITKHNRSLNATISYQPVEEIFNKCNYLIAAAGTVTLEAALHRVPTVIIYKISTLSYFLGKILINIEHIGLVNLILRNKLLPELIQDDASSENIANATITLLKNKKNLVKIRQELSRVEKCLGNPGASKRVATIAMNMLRTKQ